MNRKLKLDELERISIQNFKELPKLPVVVVLDNVRSLHNVGSIFRTCDAFRITELHLCGITATPPHREIQKTALGATESVNWKYFTSTSDSIKSLHSHNYQIVALEQTTDSIQLNEFSHDLAEKKGIALVFGNEVNGVSGEIVNLADFCVEIPQFGTKHSFNVSVTVGISLWDISNKIKKGW